MLKNLWESLRSKFQLKQMTKSKEKILQPIKTAFWKKWAWNLKTLPSNLRKIAFLNKQK